MKDFQMGYAPAAHEDFRELTGDDFEFISDYPLGTPRRLLDEHWRSVDRYKASHRIPQQLLVVIGIEQMTRADRETLAANGTPLAVWTEPDAYKRHDPVQRQLELQGEQIIADTIEQTRLLRQKMAQTRCEIEQGLAQQQQANVDAVRQYNAFAQQAGVDEKIRFADQHACQQENRYNAAMCCR